MAEEAPTESLTQEAITILEKYFRENDFPLTRHHIDTYEQCVFTEIPTIIHAANPIVFLKQPLDDEKTVFAYRVEIFIGGDAPTPEALALTISPPIVTTDGGRTVRRMFPNEARLRNLTYAAQISADILVRVTFTKPKEGAAPGIFERRVKDAPIIKNFPLFRLPILLRSKLCPTAISDPARLEEMGECRNDYGGYFVICGAEKTLITRGEQAFNSLYVAKSKDSDEKTACYASVVSLHPETKQTRRVAVFTMRDKLTGGAGAMRVNVPMVRGAFPAFILFRALGVETDEDIVRLIFPDPTTTEAKALMPLLVASIYDAYPITNRYLAIKYIMTLTKGFTEAHVLDILQNLLLAHVPDEPMARALYLAEMIRESLRVVAGFRPNTDRDDMRNQRFLTTGVLVRELFNGAWKDWRAEVILTIDRTYRKNEKLYEGEQVFSLFDAGNLGAIFQPELLTKSILRGFRGRWGTNERNEKKGVLQPLARISYLDALSHTRRVVSDFDTSMKSTGPRKLHTSQIGYFCTSETPQGAHIGATKNMSIMTQFSIFAPPRPLYDWLRTKGGVSPVAESTAALRASASVVQINGGTVGFTTEPLALSRVLKLMKWNAMLPPTASIAFNTMDKTLRIFLDEGRPIRPLWHLNGEGPAFLSRVATFRQSKWRDLVFGTSPLTTTATLRSTRFLDPLADSPNATFADYETLLAPTAGFIEYCDPMEMNEAYISWWGTTDVLTTQHSHCEIHPSTMMGLMASMIPYSNHNQAPRNQLSNSQSKQGIGTMATNIHSRYDTYSHQLCYGEAPLCRTFYYENIANGEMPYGFNCMIAVASTTGYNQDDGLIINKDSIARGMFKSMAFRSYNADEDVDKQARTSTHIANPSNVPTWTSLRPGLDYSRLDGRGIIREGEFVDDKTVLVGRYMVIQDTHEIKDVSVTPGVFTKGRVDSVVVLHQGDGTLLVKIRICEMRSPVLGDKFSTRHGQKGTIGMFVSAADMPRTADGIVPDVIVNPGGMISRMTVAQLIEMVAGRAAAAVAAKMHATTFFNGGDFVTQLGDTLQALGVERHGENIMYSGITGAQIQTEIFMCPLYFMRLKHLTDDKVNARGAGRREIRTHQPTGGRSNEGGLRVGEMERDTLCSHGISAFLQESMMKRGDATDFWICNGCGRIPIYNEPEQLFVCPTCDGPLNFTGYDAATLSLQLPTKQSRVTFSRIEMPYAMKLLDQEFTSFGNAGFRIVTEKTVARLRDSDWPWPTGAIEFIPGARDVEVEGGAVNPDALGAATEAIAEAAKPKRKQTKAAAAAGAATGVVPGAEGAAEVVAAAEKGVGGAGAGAGPMTTAIRFYSKLQNEYMAFSNFAPTPFSITNIQVPAPNGSNYPLFRGVIGGSSAMGYGPEATWPTVEHYYQAMKFPTDPDWQEEIRRAATPAKAKKMGLSGEHPLRGDWDTIKERVMKQALLAKFRQNLPLLALLQGTGDRPLVEASPGDPYWGIGRGNGKNRLGVLLQEVRTELKDLRVDEEILAAAPKAPIEIETGGDEGSEALGPADLATVAGEVVAAAAPAAGQLVTGEVNQKGGALVPGQQGIYLFINPQVGGAVEGKARRARSAPRRSISWDGMEVSREGVDSPVQSGGGEQSDQQSSGGEALTTESGNNTVVNVQKLE